MIEDHFDEDDLEYWMIIKKGEIKELARNLEVKDPNIEQGILLALQQKFGGMRCFYDIREFFDKKRIRYEYDLWR
jgi:hypothetical protein